jgi:formate dehydrogenase (coenzyme F420) beta subunit
MESNAILPVEKEGILETIKTFLAILLEKKLVDVLFVPVELPGGGNVVPTIVSGSELLKAVNPLAPVMPVNSARLISMITGTSTSPKKLGVVMRPCELRALVELVKLKQASLDNLLLIGIDCPGTYSVTDYRRVTKENGPLLNNLLNNLIEDKEDPLLRKACQTCEYPIALKTDINIGIAGMDIKTGIILEAKTESGKNIFEALGLKEVTMDSRKAAVTKLLSRQNERRTKFSKQTETDVHGLENLQSTLAACVNCHNCRTACPLCYCRECFFDSPLFDFEAGKYLGWAERKGALRMPTDILLYHLTRLNHMATSCVGCGMCTEACPNKIQVSDVFRMVGYHLQKSLDYTPGRSLDEELPLTTFREDELDEVGR